MRVMAIDYGDAHTGVALSDPTGFLVGTTTTINSWRQEVVVDRLARLIEEHRPDEVVLGFPKNMDGTDGRKADLYRELAAALEEVTGMEVILWDERRTTIDAHQILMNNGKNANMLGPGNVVPAVTPDKVIVVAPDRYMTAIDRTTGQTLWRNNSHRYRQTADTQHPNGLLFFQIPPEYFQTIFQQISKPKNFMMCTQ